jgi:hypothetical protein
MRPRLNHGRRAGWAACEVDPVEQPAIDAEPLLDPARDVLVFGGMQLEVASGGYYPALVHGTVRPEDLAPDREPERISMPCFVRVRADGEVGCTAHKAELERQVEGLLRAELAALSLRGEAEQMGRTRLVETLAAHAAGDLGVSADMVQQEELYADGFYSALCTVLAERRQARRDDGHG